MFRLHELTLAQSRNSRCADGGNGRPVRYFSSIYQGLKRDQALVNPWQGDFAEDLSEEGTRRKRQGKLTNRCRHSQDCIQKADRPGGESLGRTPTEPPNSRGARRSGRTIMSAHPFQWSAQSSVKTAAMWARPFGSSPPAARSQACCLRRANRAEPCRSPRSWPAGRT